MWKRGYNVHSWRMRYFIAYDKSRNYRIDYFNKSDKCIRSLKGCILCQGYEVIELTPGEQENLAGPNAFVIKLARKLETSTGQTVASDAPKDSEEKSRIWYFRLDTLEEKVQWEGLFSNACFNAQPDKFDIAHALREKIRDIDHKKCKFTRCSKSSFKRYEPCLSTSNEKSLSSVVTAIATDITTSSSCSSCENYVNYLDDGSEKILYETLAQRNERLEQQSWVEQEYRKFLAALLDPQALNLAHTIEAFVDSLYLEERQVVCTESFFEKLHYKLQ